MDDSRVTATRAMVFRDNAPRICAHFRFGAAVAEASGARLKDVYRPHPVQDDCDLKTVNNVKSLASAVERTCGSLDGYAAKNLTVHTQTDFVEWSRLFVPPSEYTRIYNAASRQNEVEPLLMVVRPVGSAAPDMRGRRRFYCTGLPVETAGGKKYLRPVLVCHTKAIADAVRKEAAMLVAAWPHLTLADRRDPQSRHDALLPVFLHITHPSQIAAIDDRYWRHARPQQASLFDALNP